MVILRNIWDRIKCCFGYHVWKSVRCTRPYGYNDIHIYEVRGCMECGKYDGESVNEVWRKRLPSDPLTEKCHAL